MRRVHRGLPRQLRSSLCTLTTAVVLLASLASAQTARQDATTTPEWSVGVIVSQSAGSSLGAQQARAAEIAAAALARGGVYGAPFLVDVRDDAGDPRRAAAIARELIDQGALALVCCSAPAASERVSAVAEELGVVLLGLDGGSGEPGVWTLPLRPSTRTQLTALAVHAANAGKSGLALMTLDNAFGDDAAEAFERALADAGRQPLGTVRYPPSASVLTPEALWAATRAPGAVVVWGLQADSALALEGLRRRGWFGPAYVRPETIPTGTWGRVSVSRDPPSAPPAASDIWWQVRSAAAPVSVAALLPPDHPNREQALAARERLEAAGVRVDPAALANVALVDDALVLLQRAFETVAALALPPSLPVSSQRQAVLDALVSAPAQPLAAGTYDARSGDGRFARWQGLVVVTVR